jgi:ASC-1-like (ASCH) protein
MIHDLKIKNNYLNNLIIGKKKSEIRLNDRDYQVKDVLRFKNKFVFEISHIHSGLGLKGNYVVLSLNYIDEKNNGKHGF